MKLYVTVVQPVHFSIEVSDDFDPTDRSQQKDFENKVDDFIMDQSLFENMGDNYLITNVRSDEYEGDVEDLLDLCD